MLPFYAQVYVLVITMGNSIYSRIRADIPSYVPRDDGPRVTHRYVVFNVIDCVTVAIFNTPLLAYNLISQVGHRNLIVLSVPNTGDVYFAILGNSSWTCHRILGIFPTFEEARMVCDRHAGSQTYVYQYVEHSKNQKEP